MTDILKLFSENSQAAWMLFAVFLTLIVAAYIKMIHAQGVKDGDADRQVILASVAAQLALEKALVKLSTQIEQLPDLIRAELLAAATASRNQRGR